MLATNRIIGIYAAVLQAYTLIVCIACTQLHKVKESLEGINRKEFKSVSDLNEKETGEMQDELNKTVRHHQLIIRYSASSYDDIYDVVQRAATRGNPRVGTQPETILFGAGVFESVSEGAWDSDWVGISIPYQRCISFIIAISNKGFKLTAGKFIPVSNSTLMNCHRNCQCIAKSAADLKQMLEELDRISKEAGLSMNPEKTKLMTNTSEDRIHLNGQPLEYVEDYTYLGQNLSFSSNSEKEIKRRISMAWKKFWSLKFILTDKFQKLSLKVETLEKCVLPVLLYGCQTWSLTSKQRRMLQTSQRSMERKILQLSLRNKVRNEELRNRTGMKDALIIAESLKWKWGGHVVRMDHRRWTHRLTLWDPRIGRRRVGRQTTRWADFFKKKAGPHWTSSTGDRQLWRNLEATLSELPDKLEIKKLRGANYILSKSTRQARKQRGSGKQWLLGARGPRGNRLTEREDIVTAATNYYRSLYTSSKQEENPSDSIQMNNVDDIEVPPILQSEVRTAIGELKSGKAPGEDNIHNEHLKLGHDSLLTPLTAVFNEILKSETVPHQWKTSKIILLHKKGAKDDLNNYRPISLMSNVYKLLSKIITRRLTKVLDDNQAPDQAGFRSGYSTVDHLQTINQVIEKTDEFNIPLYLAFIDFKKAFDSVEHSCVLQALKREGQIFRIGRGVRQGDPISPKLFTSLLEDIFRKLKWKKRHGININGYRLTNLRFADDIVLFAKNATDLQEMIQELSDCSAHAGLSMNMEKTQVMTNSQPQPIQVNATRLQYVEEYIYLGQLVGFKSCMTRELKRRIASAWRAFWSLQFILLDKKLNRKLKLEVLQSCIFPTLLYGCQTWKLTVNQKTQIQICQRKMERKILGLSLRDKISNTRLKQMTNTRDMAHQGERLKWKWGGHLSRLQGCRWAHISTTWDPRIGR
ncbi:hypothetical protein ANN_17330 [Periplaneta americana]|uniref:Reverse transcriptase domain-containing protein n=1 Tax=Periplaneta americana TaxID=6978 RepID=A0ABQ8STX9_PERAM|nr:hypothetical protein ANN_17330 [Periplaneta americana]